MIDKDKLYSVLSEYLPEEELNEVYSELSDSKSVSIRDKVKDIIEGYLYDNMAFYDLEEEDKTLFYHTTLFAPGNIRIPLNIIADFDMNSIGFMAALDEVPKEFILLTCDMVNKINDENFYGSFAIETTENFIHYKLFYFFTPDTLSREVFDLYAKQAIETLQEYYPILIKMCTGDFEVSDKKFLKESIKSLLDILRK